MKHMVAIWHPGYGAWIYEWPSKSYTYIYEEGKPERRVETPEMDITFSLSDKKAVLEWVDRQLYGYPYGPSGKLAIDTFAYYPNNPPGESCIVISKKYAAHQGNDGGRYVISIMKIE